MKNIALRLRYDGSAYHGWQVQKTLPTVAETLETALGRICGGSVKLTGCGRTDAGVHALRYCANFRTDSRIPLDRLPLAANALLPADIAVEAACEVEPDFNAVLSCKKKEYIYRIHNARIRDPFWEKRVCFYPAPLDAETMAAAGRAFEGTQDFAAVRSVAPRPAPLCARCTGAGPGGRATSLPWPCAPTGFCTTWSGPLWELWSTPPTASFAQRTSPPCSGPGTGVSPALPCPPRGST